MVLYNPELAILGIVHGLIGVVWMGIHVANELYLIPDMRKGEKLADMPGLRKAKDISVRGTILGILTLLSGLAFFFAKWRFDPGTYTADPEARTVLVGLGLVIAVLILGFGVLRPGAMSIGKRAAAMSPMDPLPDDLKADIRRLAKFLNMSMGLVSLAFISMLVAINGGI